MTDHVTTEQLRNDLAKVMHDAEALIKATAEPGQERLAEAKARSARPSMPQSAGSRTPSVSRPMKARKPCVPPMTTSGAIPGRRWGSRQALA